MFPTWIGLGFVEAHVEEWIVEQKGMRREDDYRKGVLFVRTEWALRVWILRKTFNQGRNEYQTRRFCSTLGQTCLRLTLFLCYLCAMGLANRWLPRGEDRGMQEQHENVGVITCP